MNQRIRELAEQATTEDSDGFRYFDKQKFAELIVQECCDIFVDLGFRPADLAVLDVKKHFGVSE